MALDPDRYYTTREAADVLRCAQKTVWKYIRADRLGAKKGVRPYLISGADLQTFIDSISDEEEAG